MKYKEGSGIRDFADLIGQKRFNVKTLESAGSSIGLISFKRKNGKVVTFKSKPKK